MSIKKYNIFGTNATHMKYNKGNHKSGIKHSTVTHEIQTIFINFNKNLKL